MHAATAARTPSVHLDDPNQGELPFEAEVRDLNWLYLRRYLSQLQQEFERNSEFLAYLATRWWGAYEMLRSFETTVILDGNPSQFELTYFRACLAEVKGRGLHLLNLIAKNDHLSLEKQVPFTAEDISAVVAELQSAEGVVYQAMTPARRTEIARSLGIGERAEPPSC